MIDDDKWDFYENENYNTVNAEDIDDILYTKLLNSL